MFKMSLFSFDARCVICESSDLWTVSSGRSFQRTCTAIFGSAMICSFDFSLLKLTKIICYYSVLHINNNILCNNDVPIKGTVAG